MLAPRPLRRGLAAATVCALPLAGLALGSSASARADDQPAAQTSALARSQASAPASYFDRVATYPVFQNVPDGVDPADETVAEISTVTDDGTTLIYTDAAGKRVGFLDITDPAEPGGAGTVDLTELGDADDQPTSVAAVGDFVLVVVDTSGGSFTDPSGRVDIIRISDRERVRSIDLGGQPDSIAISPDGAYAAIAMENQRDEEFTPSGGDEGDLPQAPAGFVQVLDLDGAPATWVDHAVTLSAEDLAGLDTPQDAEPEYVDINADNQLVLSLQENNGLLTIDLPTREITNVWSAGNAAVDGLDTTDDGLFNPTGSIDLPREPDAVHWVGDGLVATANEGDWKGGTRGWTVFDTATGEVVWDAGNSFERIAIAHGLFNDDRAAKKGPEPEGLTFAEFGGTPYAFVGSERSNFVAVYDMTDPAAPAFRQVLPSTNGPEGLLPIPGRDLLAVSSETDDSEALVRASVALYRFGAATPSFPSIASQPTDGSAAPIGWGALGALSGVPGTPGLLYAASDSAYATGRIYTVDTTEQPAAITDVLEVTDAEGDTPTLDIEGLAARAEGGFWLADEGVTGPKNALLRTDAAGQIVETVPLPDDVAAGLGKWGLEGVTVSGSGAAETVYVVLQRALAGETRPRIGRYSPASGTWEWFGYPLETTSREGDWVGLSEITAVDDDTVAVIERDKQNGTTAAIKRIYTVDLPASTTGADVAPVTKRLAVNLLPQLRARNGWTQEKLEGMAISSDGKVFAVTDNDGLADATGETRFFRLGDVRTVFGGGATTTPKSRTRTALSTGKRRLQRGGRVWFRITVSPGVTSGRVVLRDGGRTVRRMTLRNGRAGASLRLRRVGVHRITAVYPGGAGTLPSTSRTVKVKVLKPSRKRHKR